MASNTINQQNSGDLEKTIHTRFIKSWLDLIFLVELKQKPHLSGYNLLVLANERFEVQLSPGTVYSTLYQLERKGFIKAQLIEKVTVYEVTGLGEDMLRAFKASHLLMMPLMSDLIKSINEK